MADVSAKFTVEANAVVWHSRLASFGNGHQDVDELMVIDRAAMQFEINVNVSGNRRRCGEGLNEFRARIHRTNPFPNLPPVS